MAASLRPSGADDLGLRRALSDRMLPLLVGAMVFLAALALAGAWAAASLAGHWKMGAASMVTVTVPMPDAVRDGTTRAEAASRVLAATPGIDSARLLSPGEIALLLKPWLGADVAGLGLHLPAMFEVRVAPGAPDPGLAERLASAAPGSLVEHNGQWLARLAELVRSLQACAALALLIVTFVAAAMVGVATRAGLAARRDAIEIVHSLGATDGMIAGRFARRVAALVLLGAVIGVILAVPVLLALAHLAGPFAAHGPGQGLDQTASDWTTWLRLPPLLWASLACLPIAAALIGWATAQATVHGWLRRLA